MLELTASHRADQQTPAGLVWGAYIPARADRFYEIPEQVRNMIDQVDDSIYVAGVEFTDAAGNRWERDPRGTLVPRS
jgi:hypothetical protein